MKAYMALSEALFVLVALFLTGCSSASPAPTSIPATVTNTSPTVTAVVPTATAGASPSAIAPVSTATPTSEFVEMLPPTPVATSTGTNVVEGYVWEDANKDGLRQSNEPGVQVAVCACSNLCCT